VRSKEQVSEQIDRVINDLQALQRQIKTITMNSGVNFTQQMRWVELCDKVYTADNSVMAALIWARNIIDFEEDNK
jgi:hypothetical protein